MDDLKLADGRLPDAVDELADDSDRDIGLEEGLADLAQAFVDVLLSQLAARDQTLDGA